MRFLITVNAGFQGQLVVGQPSMQFAVPRLALVTARRWSWKDAKTLRSLTTTPTLSISAKHACALADLLQAHLAHVANLAAAAVQQAS
jgi:hypothetical protein